MACGPDGALGVVRVVCLVVHEAGVVGAMCDDHGVANKGDLWGRFSSREAGWHCSVLYVGAA